MLHFFRDSYLENQSCRAVLVFSLSEYSVLLSVSALCSSNAVEVRDVMEGCLALSTPLSQFASHLWLIECDVY